MDRARWKKIIKGKFLRKGRNSITLITCDITGVSLWHNIIISKLAIAIS
jgi:hypothetical protein